MAPMANMTNDDPAATHGDGFGGVDTELLDQVEVGGPGLVAVQFLGGLGGGGLGQTHLHQHLHQLRLLPCGLARMARRSTTTSDSICSLAVVTEVYSPSAIEKAPASSPATPARTTVSALAPAPTPAINAVLDTSPSMAPNVAARSHPR